jgi:hypothetical protein
VEGVATHRNPLTGGGLNPAGRDGASPPFFRLSDCQRASSIVQHQQGAHQMALRVEHEHESTDVIARLIQLKLEHDELSEEIMLKIKDVESWLDVEYFHE